MVGRQSVPGPDRPRASASPATSRSCGTTISDWADRSSRTGLWFFTNLRDQGAYRKIPGMFANKNVGDPNKRTYEADLSRPAKSAGSWTVYSLRLTTQATPKNRVGIFWDEQRPCHGGSFAPGIEACREPKDDYVLGGSVGSSSPVASAINAPETASYSGGNYLRVQQATWSSTVSNRLLLEAGFGTYMNHWGGVEIPGNPTRDIVRVVEQCTDGCAANGGIAGPDLSVAELGDQHSEGGQLEGLGVVCHRPAQLESWLSGVLQLHRRASLHQRIRTCSIASTTASPTSSRKTWPGITPPRTGSRRSVCTPRSNGPPAG